MRLLLTLRAKKTFAYESNYFHKLQGLLYSRLPGTAYEQLHDKKGYKFFCFSNVFPAATGKPVEEGSLKNLILSSPDKQFIKTVKEKLPDEMNIGEMQFTLFDAQELETRMPDSCIIKTATPIIIRIPRYRYADYGITSQRSYEFWRPKQDFTAFLKQLSENIIKKYNEFHKTESGEQNVFQQFVFDGTYPVHPIIEGKERTHIGSYWKFIFSHLTTEQKEILRFALDCGFGELNSLGFGFVNVVKNGR